MQQCHSRIVDTICAIKKEDWEALFGNEPEGYWFYKTLEESNLAGFTYRYLLMYNNTTPIAIAPLFIADFYTDNVLDPGLVKWIGAVRKVLPRFLVFKTLFCGSPFGEWGSIGMPKGGAGGGLLLERLQGALNAYCKESGSSLIIFKDFSAEDTTLLDGLQPLGFFKTDSFPSSVIDLTFASFEDYLASLSHAARKDLRRKLKKAQTGGNVTMRVVERVDDIIDDIYRLYLNTYEAGKTKFEKLTREFFIKASENAGDRCKYFLYYINGKLAAFNLCFMHNDMIIDKFIGFDYELSRQYSLYFVSWCLNLQWCLDNGIRHYQVGQTDYEPKTYLGCRLVPLYAYVRHTNGLVNRLLQVLERFVKI
jgi:predicted N-acyltransferase